MAKRIRRIIGAMFIIASIILTQIPPRLSEAASVAKEDFLLDNETLTKYTGTATTVSVSDDIKVIGEEAFASNPYLGVINIGKNVKEIRHGAFANCSYLSRVVIPDNVTSIGSAAFSGCSSLKNVSIGSGVEEIGEGVFAGCPNLAGISVSRKNDNLKYEAGVLYDDTRQWLYTYLSGNQYEAYQMPNTVEHISPYSFWGNENLSEVYLSSHLNEVPAYAFSNCKNLKSVQIPYSVNYIDAKAFENCVNLTDVEIPGSVTYISPSAFDGCAKLNIIADEGTPAYEFFKQFKNSDIDKAESQDTVGNVQNIERNDELTNESTQRDDSVNEESSTSTGLRDASKDPSNVDWMPSITPDFTQEDPSIFGKTIIVGGKAVFFIDREMDVKQIERDDISSDMAEQKEVNESLQSPEENDNEYGTVIYDSGKGGYLPKYSYINSNIAAQAFYASNSAEDFDIKQGTKNIGRFSYARSSIKELTIPDGVESIGYGAFYHCDSLEKVSIPSSVKYIGGYAFDNTPYMNRFKSDVSGEDFLIVGDGILLAYSKSEDIVNIPQGVKTIAAGCFKGNERLRDVFIPDTCKLIDSDAFRDCSKLERVSGAANVEAIGDRAFMGCPLKDFDIPDSVEYIGLRAIDFSSTQKADNEKAIGLNGENLPKVTADETSTRLSNDEYRKDALHNVLYAVVDDKITADMLEGSVLDNDSMGFSGMVVSLEKNSAGEPTGKANVIANHIYSAEVLEGISKDFVYKGSTYSINDFDSIKLSSNPYENSSYSKNLNVYYNGEKSDVFKAEMSEQERLGDVFIEDSIEAENAIRSAYLQLFGNEDVDMKAYNISVKDSSGNFDIGRLGQSVLYITVPLEVNGSIYHAVTLDEDGQLEELKASVDENVETLIFETNHLSYFGIYATGEDNMVLNLKDGKVVKNYRLDQSPNTGDKTFSVYYVYAILCFSLGCIFLLSRKKKFSYK